MSKKVAKKQQVHFNKPVADVLRERKTRRELNQQQQIAQERMADLKKPRPPRGGAPPVKIPPLNAEPVEGGGTMAQQAEVLRDATSPLSPAYDPNLAMMADQMKTPQGVPRMRPDGQVESDEGGPFAPLPPEAQQEPGFMPGVGAMYKGNQPHLGKTPAGAKPPARPGEYKPELSDETKQSMQALAEFQAAAERKQQEVKEEEQLEVKDLEKEARVNQLNQGNEAAYQEIRSLLDDDTQWNLLNNPKRRKTIEDRIRPMDITEIILHGEVHQVVPIVPGKLEVTYRSVSGEEDLAIKRMMFGETGGDRYLMDKFTLMQLTLALKSINDDELPTHLGDKGTVDEEKFIKKFEKVIKFPLQLLGDLGVQYLWFDERVRKLFLGGAEELKNT
jgi:hypothetical protein